MTERWLPILRYEGLYEVSDLGRVRSLDRVVPFRDRRPMRRGSRRTGVQFRTGRVLAFLRQPNNIREVAFHRDGERRHASVARCVFEAFIGHIPPNHVIFWKDGDRTNNRPSNLGVKLSDGLSRERLKGSAPRINNAAELAAWGNQCSLMNAS